MIDLAVIVSSFNRAPLLREALKSLDEALATLHLSSIVYVFDAGSEDGSRELVEAFQKDSRAPVKLLGPLSGANSFSAGVNFAVDAALARKPRFLMLFETDNVLLSGEPIARAVRLLEGESELGAVGFTVRKHDGSPAGFGCPFPGTLTFAFGPQIANALRLDRPRAHWRETTGSRWTPCDVVYTSPIIVRRESWDKASGFDADLFPFSDCDLDWAWRLRKAGFQQAVIETSQVIHDNRQQISHWSAQRSLHFHRARLALLERHCQTSRALLAPVLFLRHALELLAAPRRAARTCLLLTRVFSGYR